MTTRLSILSLALLLLLTPAHADDDAFTRAPDAFRQRVRVLATVERDVSALRVLVNGAVDLHAGEADWLPTWIDTAKLLEQHDQRGDALALLRMVTDKHARQLGEAQKTQVHEAMLRLLPPGTTATSPLGTIFKVAAGKAPAVVSPLEKKIRDLFEKLTVASIQDAKAINRAQQQIAWALRDTGPEVYPVLGQIVLAGQPEQARYAAEMLAQFAETGALRLLARAVVSGDGMARAAAVHGYQKLVRSAERSPTVVKHLDELLARGLPPEVARLLRYVLISHLSVAEILQRYAKGGPSALDLLKAAIGREPSDAVVRAAIDRARQNESERDELVGSLNRFLFRGHVGHRGYQKLDPVLLRPLVELMASVPPSSKRTSAYAITQVLARIRELDPALDTDAIFRPAWKRLTPPQADSTAPQRLVNYVQALLNAGYLPPLDLYEGEAWRESFFMILSRMNIPTPYERANATRPEFWARVFDTLPALSPDSRQNLLTRLRGRTFMNADTYPGSLPGGRAWADVLGMEPFRSDNRRLPAWVMRAAAGTGDERVLAALRRMRDSREWKEGQQGNYLSALKFYPGPGLLEFAEEVFRNPAIVGPEVTQLVWVLAAHGAEGRDLLVRLAGDWNLPVAPRIVRLFGVGALRDTADALKQLYPRVLEHYDEVNETYLTALINRAQALLHVEAVPLLLHAYREHVTSAATALDALRDYKARLDAFEGGAGARREQRRAEEARAMVFQARMQAAAENPAERKALVYAHAAQYGKEAAAQLVQVAGHDPDQGVREAALKALEALALGTVRAR